MNPSIIVLIKQHSQQPRDKLTTDTKKKLDNCRDATDSSNEDKGDIDDWIYGFVGGGGGWGELNLTTET